MICCTSAVISCGMLECLFSTYCVGVCMRVYLLKVITTDLDPFDHNKVLNVCCLLANQEHINPNTFIIYLFYSCVWGSPCLPSFFCVCLFCTSYMCWTWGPTSSSLTGFSLGSHRGKGKTTWAGWDTLRKTERGFSSRLYKMQINDHV